MNQDLMTAVYDFISNLEDSDLPANQSVTLQSGNLSVTVAIGKGDAPAKAARKKAVKSTPPDKGEEPTPEVKQEATKPKPEKTANIDKDQMLDEMRLYLEEGDKDSRAALKGFIFELGAKNTDMLKKSDYPKVVAFCKGEKL